MTSRVLQRPARVPAPEVPSAPRSLPPVPQLMPPQTGAAAWLPYLLPMVGGLGGLLYALVNPTPLNITIGVLFALSSVGMGFGMGYAQSSAQQRKTAGDRGRYLDYLRGLRIELREVAARQRQAGFWRHPDPQQLWAVAGSRLRLWERRRSDPDALEVRVGVGRAPLATPLEPVEPDPLARLDSVAEGELRRVLADYGGTDGVPLTVPLQYVGVLTVVGNRQRALDLARSMVAEVVALHPPDDVRVVVCADPVSEWAWVKWLPHLTNPDAIGPERVAALCTDAAGLADLVADELHRRRAQGTGATGSRPHLLIVVDAPRVAVETALELDAGSIAGLSSQDVTVLDLVETRAAEPPHVDARLELLGPAGGTLVLGDGDGRVLREARPDRLGPNAAAALARRLAPWRLGIDDGDRAMAVTVELPDLLDVPDVGALQPERLWTGLTIADRLRVPVGVAADGSPLRLDLKESALGGMGPHGLIVGATGSGKSELLRTLVLALGIRHAPDELALVLVDFKGGAAFAGLQALPHVAGMITNLADDLAMVDRMREALFGELRRRQEMLRAAGDLASIWDYQRARQTRPELEPMPSLLVVVDEFGELLSGRPDFAELFVAIGRLGRSLGVHLLLASQRLEEGKLRGLDSHLSYRIGLRTFSAEDSRTVLGVPDAYQLPPVPGSAFLKVDTTVFTRFKVALASAEYRPPDPADAAAAPASLFQALPPASGTAPRADPERPISGSTDGSVLDVAVARLAHTTARVHQVWLPPLPPSLPLSDLLPVAGDAGAGLRIPVGLADKPADQTRDVLSVDLAAAHLVLVGGPQSGKSTLVRTLVCAAALTLDPTQVHVLAVDAGGGGLAALQELPHAAGIAARLDRERVRRVLATMAGLLDRRERLFRDYRIDGAAAMRAARGGVALPAEDLADVLLVIDGWAAFRNDFEDLEPVVVDLVTRGLGYGLHLVITSGRWGDMRAQIRDAIAGRLELRLADPGDSDLDRKLALALPEGTPGRGLTRDRLYFQTALPQLGAGTDELVAHVAAGWDGPPAPAVRLLPEILHRSELPGTPDQQGVPVGIGEVDLGPVSVDLIGSDTHLLVLGDGESGKTTVLHTFLHGLQQKHPPQEAVVVLVDYRRTLLDAVDEEHLLSYAGAVPAATDTIAELAHLMLQRLPPADVDRDALRNRSWWKGPEVYVVVDDYDLVATQSGNPLAPLADLLPQARDIGLHVVLARRVGGISRAMFDVFLGRLRELGAAGLLLSGDPGEGPLLGSHRAGEQPPGRGLLLRRRQPPLLVQIALPDVGGGT